MDAGIRAELDTSDESLGKKIRAAKTEKVPYFLVIGDKEIAAANVTLESRSGEAAAQLTGTELIEKLRSEIAARS
jgi:threonyl-tRNA synthetase